MVLEGKAKIRTDDVFYNPEMGTDRDITVAALNTWKNTHKKNENIYADVTCATGIRGIRASLEANYDVIVNDRSKEAIDIATKNIRKNNIQKKIQYSNKDANIFLRNNNYEVVDVDPFGSPIPFADSAFNSTLSLACFTATDLAPLCGAHSSGKRRYSCIPLNTEYHSEMGVRVLIGALARTAVRYDISVTPILSYSLRHYARTLLAIDKGAKKSNKTLNSIGHISHCFNCLYRTYSYGVIFDGERDCPNCGEKLDIAGPLWIDSIYKEDFIQKTENNLKKYMDNYNKAKKILSNLGKELDIPTHYDHHVLCKNWDKKPSKLEDLIENIRDNGFKATKTHYSGTSFKTNAEISDLKHVI